MKDRIAEMEHLTAIMRGETHATTHERLIAAEQLYTMLCEEDRTIKTSKREGSVNNVHNR